MTPEYIEVEYNGETVRQWPDGSLRRPEGQLVAQHPLAAPTIDKELSAEYNQRRWDASQQKQQDAEAEIARALVSQVAKARTPAAAAGKLAGHLVAELDADGSVKEHGIKNYVGGVDWVLKAAGLIEEKKADNRQVHIENLNLDAGVASRMLSLLAPAGGDGSRAAEGRSTVESGHNVAASVPGRQQDSGGEAEDDTE